MQQVEIDGIGTLREIDGTETEGHISLVKMGETPFWRVMTTGGKLIMLAVGKVERVEIDGTAEHPVTVNLLANERPVVQPQTPPRPTPPVSPRGNKAVSRMDQIQQEQMQDPELAAKIRQSQEFVRRSAIQDGIRPGDDEMEEAPLRVRA